MSFILVVRYLRIRVWRRFICSSDKTWIMEDDEISMSIDSNNQTGASGNTATTTTTLQGDNVDNMSTTNIDTESKTENVEDSLPPITSSINGIIDPLSHDLDKPLRQVRSHPSLGGRSAIPPGSLGSLAMTRSLKNNFNKTGITVAASAQQPGNSTFYNVYSGLTVPEVREFLPKL